MYKVLNTNDLEWNTYIFKMPYMYQDIYFTREYMLLYENNGDGVGQLFVYCEDDNVAIYPYLLNEIDGYDLLENYFDIQTAYGYGGPLISNLDESFRTNFEQEFLKYCLENNIVAEFVRFHPYMENQNVFKEKMDVIHNRMTVCLDLEPTIDEIWKNSINSKNRNMIRKAEKNMLYIDYEKDIKAFRELYEGTMDKVSATGYYYFEDSYYEEMMNDDHYRMISVKKDNRIIASAIFMCFGYYMHYHLAGSDKAYLSYAPNNLLLWEAIKYAKKEGCQLFHFGGGLEDDIENPLFKFKSAFSKQYLDFYIGKRVHNQKIYSSLIKSWEEKNKKEARLLLQYRD